MKASLKPESVVEVARFGICMSDPLAFRALNVLREMPLCRCEFAQVLGVSDERIKLALKKLRDAGLVVIRSRSVWDEYRINERYRELLGELFDSFDYAICSNELTIGDRDRLAWRLTYRVNGWCRIKQETDSAH